MSPPLSGAPPQTGIGDAALAVSRPWFAVNVAAVSPLGPLAPRRHRFQNLDLVPDRVLEFRSPRILLSRKALLVPLTVLPL